MADCQLLVYSVFLVLVVALVLVAGRPVLLALRRASRRAAFDAPVVFDAEDVRR